MVFVFHWMLSLIQIVELSSSTEEQIRQDELRDFVYGMNVRWYQPDLKKADLKKELNLFFLHTNKKDIEYVLRGFLEAGSDEEITWDLIHQLFIQWGEGSFDLLDSYVKNRLMEAKKFSYEYPDLLELRIRQPDLACRLGKSIARSQLGSRQDWSLPDQNSIDRSVQVIVLSLLPSCVGYQDEIRDFYNRHKANLSELFFEHLAKGLIADDRLTRDLFGDFVFLKELDPEAVYFGLRALYSSDALMLKARQTLNQQLVGAILNKSFGRDLMWASALQIFDESEESWKKIERDLSSLPLSEKNQFWLELFHSLFDANGIEKFKNSFGSHIAEYMLDSLANQKIDSENYSEILHTFDEAFDYFFRSVWASSIFEKTIFAKRSMSENCRALSYYLLPWLVRAPTGQSFFSQLMKELVSEEEPALAKIGWRSMAQLTQQVYGKHMEWPIFYDTILFGMLQNSELKWIQFEPLLRNLWMSEASSHLWVASLTTQNPDLRRMAQAIFLERMPWQNQEDFYFLVKEKLSVVSILSEGIRGELMEMFAAADIQKYEFEFQHSIDGTGIYLDRESPF